jgi:MFS family permease
VAPNQGLLVGARLVQGIGAAMMMPAALSILTTTFTDTADRVKAIGAWGGMGGLGSAAGVFLGGVLSESLGWRWVLFVNLPVCAAVLLGVGLLIAGDRRVVRKAGFDLIGAALATAGALLLVFTLVRAPDAGWASFATVAGMLGAVALLGGFVINEQRSPDPLVPLSIFRIKGLAAADATQLIAIAGFYSTFFFITLYMQNVVGYSQLQAGSAYLPVTVGVGLAAGVCTKLFTRTGTRPVIVAGSLIAAAGVFDLSRIPLNGSYVADLLPGLVAMAIGLGAVFVGVTTAANAGVPADQAGLAAALLNTSQQIGAALGLAVLSAVATSRSNHLLAAHAGTGPALTAGFRRALEVCAALLIVAALIAARAMSARREPLVPADEAEAA